MCWDSGEYSISGLEDCKNISGNSSVIFFSHKNGFPSSLCAGGLSQGCGLSQGRSLQSGGIETKMANLSEEELRENIAEILRNGDLATLTSKQIREILEKKYGLNLKDRKKKIDDIVMSLVDEESDEGEEASSPDRQAEVEQKKPKISKESPVKKQKVSERVSVIVPSIKDNAKDEKSSESEEESDDDGSSDDTGSKRRERKGKNKRQAKKSPSKQKPKPSKKVKGEKGEGKKKSGFSMPMVLSPELASLMGETRMARSEVVKKMWQIIKERNLMDPSNKRYTICDAELEKVIGQKRFLTFSMMKYLKKHVKDPSLFE